jgi:hypothetical protein
MYFNTFRSMCAVPIMAVFCSSLVPSFQGTLLGITENTEKNDLMRQLCGQWLSAWDSADCTALPPLRTKQTLLTEFLLLKCWDMNVLLGIIDNLYTKKDISKWNV